MSRATEPLFMERIHLVTNAVCDRHMPKVEYRPDGWPLCPNCGQDELYSLSIPPTIETIRGCYLCGPISPMALPEYRDSSLLTPDHEVLSPVTMKDWLLLTAVLFGPWSLFFGLLFLLFELLKRF